MNKNIQDLKYYFLIIISMFLENSLNNFDVRKEINTLKGGEKFEVGDMLFERITPERVEELKAKYGSSK